MKVAFVISTLSHAGLMALGLVSLNAPARIEPNLEEALTVELITESEYSAIASGSLEAEIVEASANPRAAPVTDDLEPVPEIPVGNTDSEIFEPNDAEIESATPTEQSAPVPEETEAADEIEFASAPPEAEPLPELPVPDEVLIAPDSEIEQIIPEEEPETTKAAEENLPQLASLPTSVDKLRETFKANLEAARAKEAREAEKNSDINNAERSRGGKTGQGGERVIGRADASGGESLQTAMAREKARLDQCYERPPSAIAMTLEVSLDEAGKLVGNPEPMEPLSTPEAFATFRAAKRALEKCLPLNLPNTEFEEWRTTQILFEPAT